MFCCAKCGALIDVGGTEYDCPKGCYDDDDEEEECVCDEENDEENDKE